MKLEIIYSSVPLPHAAAQATEASQEVIRLPDAYAPAMVDYIMSRAYAKDAEHSAKVTMIERIFGWIAGNRAAKLAGEGRENLFSETDIAALKGINRGTTADSRIRSKLYDEVFKEFQQYRDDVLAIAEQTGIISPESRAMWRDEFYVPFYRVMDEDASPKGPRAAKGLSRQEAYKKAERWKAEPQRSAGKHPDELQPSADGELEEPGRCPGHCQCPEAADCRAGRVYADVKRLQELGLIDDARELVAEKRRELGMRRALNGTQRELAKINNRMDMVRRGDWDGERKRAELDRLQVFKSRLTERAGKIVEELRARK